LINENNRNEITHFKDKPIEEFLFIKEKLKDRISELEHECIVLGNEMAAVLQNSNIDIKVFSRGTFPNHVGYIQKGELSSSHKKYFVFDDVQVNKSAKDDPAVAAVIEQLLPMLQKAYKNYERKNFYEA